MPDSEAFSRFRQPSTQEQVDVYMWDLAHKHPVASRFESILHEQPKAVAGPLLDAANKADGYMAQASALRTLARFPKDSRRSLDRGLIEAAIARCKALAENEMDELCKEQELQLLSSTSL